jgi:hypothetical protein
MTEEVIMKRKALVAGALFLALGVILLLSQQGRSGLTQDRDDQKRGPEYSIEGAWYDMPYPTGCDTFVSNAQRPGVEGTLLCSAYAVPKNPNPLNPNGWLSVTLEGHGNWVRIAKNRYAYTAMRPIVDQDGMPFGWAKFWGTITPISENEYTGTMNFQWYNLDGTLYPRSGAFPMQSHRIEIIYE